MTIFPTTGFQFKPGDSVKLKQGLHAQVIKLLLNNTSDTRSYRVRIKCPSPKPIFLDVPENQLELITRHTIRRVVKTKARAMPQVFQNEEISEADFEHILASAKDEKSASGVLRRKTVSIPNG